MTTLTLPIVVGKKYVRRDGKVITTKKSSHGNVWLRVDDGNGPEKLESSVRHNHGRVWSDDGEQPNDLVADYIDPAQSHPHALLMAQFAEDAKEMATPWDRWEKRYPPMASDWEACDSAPAWSKTCQYRRRPEVKPDPHAKNAAEYAKDMAETDKAWERWEMRLESSNHTGPWVNLLSHPCWSEGVTYRRKEQA